MTAFCSLSGRHTKAPTRPGENPEIGARTPSSRPIGEP
jgi:hypothetical protein